MIRPLPPHRASGAATLLLALATAALGACTPPVGVTDFVIVQGYRVSPTFNAFTQPCTIQYSLDEPALVQIRVVRVDPDGNKELVRQITQERRETAGPRTAAWRGVGPSGLFAPQGEYQIELYARLDGSDRTEAWTLTTIMFRS
ncbi:FlgD immunoglobulin-like domain containing protein [Rubricoccus marinus]|uniref:FlgD Ig-like domain-containing protein n=1 Tax=Rubricoccus marinus TaxID=716817 RepID=A0A259TUS1_9BACT|nr:FlgD immunoglobulin-like domain containing protein [Rubricoccus marinus]OZC01377.1 hypothetical protein BSZ36_16955 [Rubricoccus marinus]